MDVGVGFADRAAVVVAVGFLRIYGFYISASVYPLRPCRPLSKTVPGKVATTHTEDGHKQDT